MPRKPSKPPLVGETIWRRLARLRRERGLTQIELAKLLGVSQPLISAYENGELRLHAELIIRITEVLKVSSDEILGLRPMALHRTDGLNRRLRRRLDSIGELPRRDQDSLINTIDAYLARLQIANE